MSVCSSTHWRKRQSAKVLLRCEPSTSSSFLLHLLAKGKSTAQQGHCSPDRGKCPVVQVMTQFPPRSHFYRNWATAVLYPWQPGRRGQNQSHPREGEQARDKAQYLRCPLGKKSYCQPWRYCHGLPGEVKENLCRGVKRVRWAPTMGSEVHPKMDWLCSAPCKCPKTYLCKSLK